MDLSTERNALGNGVFRTVHGRGSSFHQRPLRILSIIATGVIIRGGDRQNPPKVSCPYCGRGIVAGAKAVEQSTLISLVAGDAAGVRPEIQGTE